MNASFPQSVVLTLAILAAALPTSAGTPGDNQDSSLTVSVTVPPICTVAITGSEPTEEAVVLHCRNLPDDHPEPRVDDAVPESSEDAGSNGSVAMVVINF